MPKHFMQDQDEAENFEPTEEQPKDYSLFESLPEVGDMNSLAGILR